MKVNVTGNIKVHKVDGKDFDYLDKLELIAESDDEESLLAFIKLLNEKGGFVPMLDYLVNLVNVGALVRYDGKWVWNDDWEIVDDNPMFG